MMHSMITHDGTVLPLPAELPVEQRMVPRFPPRDPVAVRLNVPAIIGLCGLAGAGKSTAAEYLEREHGFARVRFAGPLKDMMRALGLSERHIEGDLKEVPCAMLGGRTPRYAMQTIGTEWGRQLMADDFWIQAWAARLPEGQPVVVEDVRFPNEAEAIKARGGTLVRITGRRGWSDAGAGGHESEKHDLPASAIVRNTGTPEELGETIAALGGFFRARTLH